MTKPFLIAVDGNVYKPVPSGSGSVGFDIGLKLYQNEHCALYDGGGTYQKTMLPDAMGYTFNYAQTDPSNGKKYVVTVGDIWRMFNGELYMERAGYGWLKASEHQLIPNAHPFAGGVFLYKRKEILWQMKKSPAKLFCVQ